MNFSLILNNLRYRFLIVFCLLDHGLLVAVTLGNCKPYEQISSAVWGLEKDGRMVGKIVRPLVDLLLYPIQRNHCQQIWNIEQRQIILMTDFK